MPSASAAWRAAKGVQPDSPSAVRADDLLAPLFAGMDAEHARYVARWLAEVFGGPATYTAERGGYATMVGRHIGRGISEAQRRRWVNLMMDAADEAGLPDDPEFRAAFASYIEWGTRLAVRNSQPGADPVRHAPVPPAAFALASAWNWPGNLPPDLVEASRPDTVALVLSPT